MTEIEWIETVAAVGHRNRDTPSTSGRRRWSWEDLQGDQPLVGTSFTELRSADQLGMDSEPNRPDDVGSRAAAALDRWARRLWPGVDDPLESEGFWEPLSRVVGSEWAARWRTADREPGDDPRGTGPVGASSEPAETFSEEVRRESGVYPTPDELARNMARLASPGIGATVVDHAAGDGALLAAVLQEEPQVDVVGVEWHPRLALAAAVRLVSARARWGGDLVGDRIRVGDGLGREATGELEGEADVVVTNPPYLREKGRSELFERLRRDHPHLESWMGARGDVAYLFLHRAVDLLAPGGRLVALTTEYWLTATGADALRADLKERASPEAIVRTEGESAFPEAPGQHSMVSVWRRGDGAEVEPEPVVASRSAREAWTSLSPEGDPETGEDRRMPAGVLEGDRWHPFAGEEAANWGRAWQDAGTPLCELAEDRQGIVSGGDRVSARRMGSLDDPPEAVEVGDPLFVWRTDELEGELDRLRGTVVRPLLRGSDLRPDTVVVEPPNDAHLLYVDGPLEEGQLDVVEPLAALKPALATRREVERGRMPWYRLHWPRDRAEQTGPKLVVPRRARAPRFALDLSASAVSSDCTYLVPPEELESPISYLVILMVALNSAETERYAKVFGKSKGEIIEFYSDPLESLPLPLTRREGDLEWNEDMLGAERLARLRERVDEIERELGL